LTLEYVSAIPGKRKLNHEPNNFHKKSKLSTLSHDDMIPLDVELLSQYTIQCQLGGRVTMDEATLRKSSMLAETAEKDTTTRVITILVDGCNQETLTMVIF
jgi:hypothetical protein